MTYRLWGAVLLGTIWSVIALDASASPLLEEMGGFGDAGGQQARTLATGASAAYFNPALLAEASAGVTLGAAVTATRIGITLVARGDARYDVPTGLENAAHADGTRFDHYPIATQTLQLGREQSPSAAGTTARPRQAAGSGVQTLSYEMIGVVVHALQERVALGVYALIPNDDFVALRSAYVDEREQFSSNSLHPELYGDRLSALSFAFGLAYRWRSFSLGVGTGLSLRANALSPAYVADAGQLDSLVLNAGVKVKAGLAPQAGFACRPLDRWRIAGTVHTPRQLDIRTDVQFLLATGVEQSAELRLLYDWMPWQVGLGTSLDLLQSEDAKLSLAASAVYGRWSQYQDRHAERPAREFAWRDTVTAALGARFALHAWQLGVDVQYKPSPVPLQRGRSNYVDNDRIGASSSLEFAIPIGTSQLKFGAQLQGFWLLERFASKLEPPAAADAAGRDPALVRDEVPDDARIGGRPVEGAAGLRTNNPGWPGFSSEGWLTGAGLYVSLTP